MKKLRTAQIGIDSPNGPVTVEQSVLIAVKDKCFHVIDALVGLIVLLIKYSGEKITVIKVSMLHKIMQLIVLNLNQEAGEYAAKLGEYSAATENGNSSAGLLAPNRAVYFNGLPYFRLLFMLFFNLNVPDLVFDSINLFLLMTFSNSLLQVPPKK